MRKSLYRTFIKQKFFNRLFLIYTLIILFTLVFLSFIIIRNMYNSAQKDAINYNNGMLQSITSYFTQKESNARMILQQLYTNPSQSQDMFDLLTNKIDNYDQDYVSKTKLIKYYLISAVAMDRDIVDAVIYKKISQDVYSNSIDLTINTNDFLEQNNPLFKTMDGNFFGIKITPSYMQNYSLGSKLIFTIAANIRGQTLTGNFKNSVAVLSLNMSTDRIGNAFKYLEHKYDNTILVLTKDGGVVYDTSNHYYNKKYPFFDKIKSSSSEEVLGENSIISTNYNDHLGIYLVSILPVSQITNGIMSEKNTILILTTLSIIIAILFSYVSIGIFSRRVKIINYAIQKVQSGDLTYRIKLNHTNDEISKIADNFNNMCDMLIDYINKVYLSDIKQKEAQLYALQSQIDPHFLYNTLEVIRMEALEAENEQICQMIEILAQLFRNSIKDSMIVHVKDELNFCKYYLELYSIRFAGKLDIEFEIDPKILEFGIMKHLLQPIIENSVVHGIKYNRIDNKITVKGYQKEGDIFIEINDNGNGISPEELEDLKNELNKIQIKNQKSIGIANVNQRIRLVFGDRYGLTISSSKDEGTKIRMTIPAKSIQEVTEYVQSFNRG